MDGLHVHLLVNHLPILGVLIGALWLLYAIATKNRSIQLMALFTLAIAGLMIIPAFLSGEEAEHAVEHAPGISEHYLEEHEELGETAVWIGGFVGAVSLLAWFSLWRGLKFARVLIIATVIGNFGMFGLSAQLGNLGGMIRHAEIRPEATASQGGGEASPDEKEHEADDD
jgi:hypothetical protein